MPSRVEDLQQVPLFSGLSRAQLKRLARATKERQYRAGATLLREGEMSGVSFFVIAEGTVSVSVDGAEAARLGPGDHFGELALISERERAATVTVETPVRCFVMTSWDFRKFVKDNSDVSWKLLQHLAELLTDERGRRARAGLQAS